MSDGQITADYIQRESKALAEEVAKHRDVIANLHKQYDRATHRLAVNGDKLRLDARVAEARNVVLAAMDLHGYGEIDDSAVKLAQENFSTLLAEQKAQTPRQVHSS